MDESRTSVGMRVVRGIAVAGALLCGCLGAASANVIDDGTFGNFNASLNTTTACGLGQNAPTSTNQVTNCDLPATNGVSGANPWQWVSNPAGNTNPGSGNYAFVITVPYTQNAAINTLADSTIGLWGPGETTGSQIPKSPIASTHVLAADGIYQTAYVYQSLAGLVNGATYAVSFYMSAGQQYGKPGTFTDDWEVGLGSCSSGSACTAETKNTKTSTGITLVSGQGWYGATASTWLFQSLTFVADATTTALWFLAQGTNSVCGQPPFTLLSDVSMVMAVPEPPAYGVLIVALLALFGVRRALRKRG